MMHRIAHAFLAVPILAGAAQAQGFGLPEIGLQNTGACRQLAVRDRSAGTMVPLGCLDSTAGGFSLSGSALTLAKPNAFTLPYARSVTGAATRMLLDKLGDLPFTPQDMGAATDGTTPVDAAFAKLMLVPGDVTIPPGVWRLAQSATWPRGRVYRFAMGAQIRPDAGVTITIKGAVDAAPSGQIFAGAGKVVGIRESLPEWWGAVGEYGNSFDSSPAFQAAADSMRAAFSGQDPTSFSPGGRPRFRIGGGFYNLCSQINFYPASAQAFDIVGPGVTNSGGVLKTCNTFAGNAVLAIHGIIAGQDPTHDFTIRDFSVQNSRKASGANTAIAINPDGAGYSLNGFKKSKIEDVVAVDFPIGYDITNTVNLQLNRTGYAVSAANTSNNIGARLRAVGSDATANVSEIDFNNSRYVPCPVSPATLCASTFNVDMEALATGGGFNGIAAVSFNTMTFYRSNVGVRGWASGTSFINDVWFNGHSGTQFDGIGCTYLDFKVLNAGASMANVKVDGVYNTTTSSGCLAYQFSNNGGSMRGVSVTNGWFVGMGGQTMQFDGVKGLVIANNIFRESAGTGGTPIVINKSNDLTVMGNSYGSESGTPTVPSFIRIDVNSVNGIAIGNVASGLSGSAAIENYSTTVTTGTGVNRP